MQEKKIKREENTESIMGKVVEGMAVCIVSKLCIGCWESLQALQCYFGKVSDEIGMLS
jgi:hypothetical protein